MKLKEVFAILDKAKTQAKPDDLEKEATLWVDNAKQQAEAQAGEWGEEQKLLTLFLSGNCLHVGS